MASVKRGVSQYLKDIDWDNLFIYTDEMLREDAIEQLTKETEKRVTDEVTEKVTKEVTEKNTKEFVQNMLKDNVSDETILKYTNITPEELSSIKKGL